MQARRISAWPKTRADAKPRQGQTTHAKREPADCAKADAAAQLGSQGIPEPFQRDFAAFPNPDRVIRRAKRPKQAVRRRDAPISPAATAFVAIGLLAGKDDPRLDGDAPV